ncbi:MAG: phosphoglycerate mutase family protein [Hyphomonas sp.]|uniref:SixA phosphatase family protein n=2 Tax=Hyphomonas sp. TaxID=87 RepID=UPI00330286F9
MRLTRRSLMRLAAGTLLLAACTRPGPPEPDRTIYLVRHAEKQAGDDPSLTPEGAARAQLLADTLADAGIAHIYSTDYARTRETAAPLADFMSLPVYFYDASDPLSFVSELNSQSGRILVVGHSNTTPDLVGLLGGEPGVEINEAAEYDRLYVLRISGDTVESELRRYGAPYQP